MIRIFTGIASIQRNLQYSSKSSHLLRMMSTSDPKNDSPDGSKASSSTETSMTPSDNIDWNILTLVGGTSLVSLGVCASYIWMYPIYHPIAAKAVFVQMTAAQSWLAVSGGIQMGYSLSIPNTGDQRKYFLSGLVPILAAWGSTFIDPQVGIEVLLSGYAFGLASDSWAHHRKLISSKLYRIKVVWIVLIQIFLAFPFLLYFR